VSIKTTNKSQKQTEKRNGVGRPRTGITKVKKCVSVTGTVWQDALERWNGQASDLVDRLLRDYVARKAMI
jgi:hypothetical protein